MGTKMAVAFSIIFMADIEKRLLMARPYKPLVWKRLLMISFHCGAFQPKKFTNLLTLLTHSTLPNNIKFTCEISSECTLFLDTEVLKGPCLSTHKNNT